MPKRRNISELEQAIVPPLRWSPVAWFFTVSATITLGICIFIACLHADSLMVGILFVVPLIAFLICLYWLQYRCQHAFYTNGILYRQFFRDTPILFADIESYSLIPVRKNSIRDSMLGKSAAFQYRIIIFLKEDCLLKKVKILTPENDYRFDSFMDHLRTAIARRLYMDFQNNKKFDWTPDVRVWEKGVEMLGNAKNASARDVFIPFFQLDKSGIEKTETTRIKYQKKFLQTIEILSLLLSPIQSFLFGTFHFVVDENKVLHLYRVGNREPEITISCTSPNFHPGYDAFRRIVWESRGMDTNYTFADWYNL